MGGPLIIYFVMMVFGLSIVGIFLTLMLLLEALRLLAIGVEKIVRPITEIFERRSNHVAAKKVDAEKKVGAEKPERAVEILALRKL
jgi:hypothetical protein